MKFRLGVGHGVAYRDWHLGRDVEIATVIIVKFRGDKVCHEHLYWDQASALKQIGVLDAPGPPEALRFVADHPTPACGSGAGDVLVRVSCCAVAYGGGHDSSSLTREIAY